MVRNDLAGIKLEQTTEPLTGQGGFLAFGEYLKGMRLRERVKAHLPTPGSNRGFGPEVFVQALISLQMLGGQTLSDLRGLEREKPLLEVLPTFVTSRNRFKAILSPCNIGMIFCSVYVASGAP